MEGFRIAGSEDFFGLGCALPMLPNCQKVNIKPVLG